MMMQEESFGLLVSFPDQSESFTLGFEAGQIWQQMSEKVEIDRGIDTGIPIHADNLTVIQRMAHAAHFELEIGVEADGWVPIRMKYRPKAPPPLKLVDRGGHP